MQGYSHNEKAQRHNEPAPGHNEVAPLHNETAPLYNETAPLHNEVALLHYAIAPWENAASGFRYAEAQFRYAKEESHHVTEVLCPPLEEVVRCASLGAGETQSAEDARAASVAGLMRFVDSMPVGSTPNPAIGSGAKAIGAAT